MHILDSNILIGHLNGDVIIKKWIKENTEREELCISVVTRIEVLGFPGLSGSNLLESAKFINLFREIGLFGDTAELATDLKRSANLSLADSVISATAISRKMTLVTNDKILARKVKDLVKVLSLS